jgi:integrase
MLSSVNAEEVVGAIIEAMRRGGYAASTLYLESLRVAKLEESCRSDGGVYTVGAGERFVERAASRVTGKSLKPYQRLVGLADRYLETGEAGLSMLLKKNPEPTAGHSRRLLAAWGTRMRSEGWAAETIAQHTSYARRFLLWLEDVSEGGLGRADPAAADGFLTALRVTCAPSSLRTVKNVLAAFCRFAGREDLADGFAQTRTERKRSPLPVLTEQETRAVAEACRRAAPRDAAITLLALTTGLRAVDICALELGSVDWRAGRIDLVQSKTGNPLSAPLPAVVGNATARYLLEERPATADRRVFVRSVAPHTGLSGHSAVRAVVKKVFDDAGVVPVQVGTRLTRHNLASKMLAAQIAYPVIGAVLGHADPASVDAYLETDVETMRGCVLPLPEAARL